MRRIIVFRDFPSFVYQELLETSSMGTTPIYTESHRPKEKI